MTRLEGDALAAWREDNISWTVLAEADFADGKTNLWVGPLGQGVSFEGKTWNGTGELIEFDKISETVDGRDARTIVKLYLDTTSDLFFDIDSDSAGRELKIHFLIFDAETGVVDHNVSFVFDMGTTEFETVPELETIEEFISLELIGPKALLARSHFIGLTDSEQQIIKSGDRGLQFVADPKLGNVNAGERRSYSGGGNIKREFDTRYLRP